MAEHKSNAPPRLNWSSIRTVFLDMDGTLLDLNFDNQFWQVHVPMRYAELHGLDLDVAKDELFQRYRRVEGTMDWYCLDYWTRELNMDIALLKEEVDHLIAVHPHVVAFLDAARGAHDEQASLGENSGPGEPLAHNQEPEHRQKRRIRKTG